MSKIRHGHQVVPLMLLISQRPAHEWTWARKNWTRLEAAVVVVVVVVVVLASHS